MPPRRQHLVFEDAPLLGPAPLLLGGLLVQLVARADSVAVRRALVELLSGGIGAFPDPPPLVESLHAGLSQLAIGITTERQTAPAPVVPIQQRPRLHTV